MAAKKSVPVALLGCAHPHAAGRALRLLATETEGSERIGADDDDAGLATTFAANHQTRGVDLLDAWHLFELLFWFLGPPSDVCGFESNDGVDPWNLELDGTEGTLILHLHPPRLKVGSAPEDATRDVVARVKRGRAPGGRRRRRSGGA